MPDGTPLDERLWCLAQAFDAWLEGRFSDYYKSVGPDSHNAWREFLAFTGKAPWEVGVEDVNAYIQSWISEASGPRRSTAGWRAWGAFTPTARKKMWMLGGGESYQ